jgi:hypothetical protein
MVRPEGKKILWSKLLMKTKTLNLVFLLLVAALSPAAAKTKTFTGEVSDSMCGAKHMMADKAECTRTCISKGSNYALVVGDKVYTLKTSDKAALDQLNTLAGETARVTGSEDGDTIEVSKVTAAK